MSESSASMSGFGVAAVGALTFALSDLLHEGSHLLATLLPLGVRPVVISTIGVSSVSWHPLVSAAGPAANWILGFVFLAGPRPMTRPDVRYAAWLFGTVNLLSGAAYFVFSGALDAGDWAAVFNSFSASSVWRPYAATAGVVLYVGVLFLSLRVLRRLVHDGVVAIQNVDRYCAVSYWVGSSVLALGAALNPIDFSYTLSSGVASGFGAMAGLHAFGPLLAARSAPPGTEMLRFGSLWVIAGVSLTAIFIFVFGPGVYLDRSVPLHP